MVYRNKILLVLLGMGFLNTYCYLLPSVLWRCWLGGRKGIRPVKNWVVGCWRGYLSGATCRLAYSPADATATCCLFASVKSRLVLPFWYRLTRVVPEKGPLNVCVCVCVLLLQILITENFCLVEIYISFEYSYSEVVNASIFFFA